MLVAIDGPDAAGKTTCADRLTEAVDRPTLRVSLDHWHNPRAVRTRRGVDSAEGYYRDSFDHERFVHELLRPFAAGAQAISTHVFDHRTDEPLIARQQDVPTTAALLVDGVFLLRPELREHWGLSIYLHVDEAVSLQRALLRDTHLGGEDEVRRRYRARYLPGQALYRREAAPADRADIVIDNVDPPRVLRWLDHPRQPSSPTN